MVCVHPVLLCHIVSQVRTGGARQPRPPQARVVRAPAVAVQQVPVNARPSGRDETAGIPAQLWHAMERASASPRWPLEDRKGGCAHRIHDGAW